MSRSYKKWPHWSDGGPHNYGKKMANKAIRRRQKEMLIDYEQGDIERAEALEIDDGGEFKTVFQQYDIRDYVFVCFDPLSPSWANDPEYLRKAQRK